MINRTHDPALTSWVESANKPGCDFPVQNLPFGIFGRPDQPGVRSVGVAIGDCILDLGACVREGLLAPGPAADACNEASLNLLMAREPSALSQLRAEISDILSEAGSQSARARDASRRILVSMATAELDVPARIGDYTDFYASVHHATNVGSLFRPDNPLLPNYKWVPIGYHGRASSIVLSGTVIHRPAGQTKGAEAAAPVFGPSRMLDYESELGFFVGRGNSFGSTIPIESAWDHIFGFCLVNDWSARDIQSWEYQPLGPFLAKNFATTISPWIVTAEATEPYRVAVAPRDDSDPQPLPYLVSSGERDKGAISVFLEVSLRTGMMRAAGLEPHLLSRAPFSSMYWTVGQMLAHHASNGCNLRPGDLLASGTVSGADSESRGCLLEITSRGANPVTLATGETRKFLEDGDEVIMKGYLEAGGRPRIGFGECSGRILAQAV